MKLKENLSSQLSLFPISFVLFIFMTIILAFNTSAVYSGDPTPQPNVTFGLFGQSGFVLTAEDLAVGDTITVSGASYTVTEKVGGSAYVVKTDGNGLVFYGEATASGKGGLWGTSNPSPMPPPMPWPCGHQPCFNIEVVDNILYINGFDFNDSMTHLNK